MAKKPKLETVPQRIVEQAWENWIEFHYGIDCDETTQRFCDYIDKGDRNPTPVDPWNPYEDGRPDTDTNIEVPPEIAVRLRQATGPHWRTVFKAWYAVNPWK